MHRYCSPSTTIREFADRGLRAASMRSVQRAELDVEFLGNEPGKAHGWLPPNRWSCPLT